MTGLGNLVSYNSQEGYSLATNCDRPIGFPTSGVLNYQNAAGPNTSPHHRTKWNATYPIRKPQSPRIDILPCLKANNS